MTVLEILEMMEKRIKTGWCQGRPAKDYAGKPTDPNNPEAWAWCLSGSTATLGLFAKTKEEMWTYIHKAFSKLYPNFKSTDSIIQWNDTPGRTQEQVLEIIRLAKKMYNMPYCREILTCSGSCRREFACNV